MTAALFRCMMLAMPKYIIETDMPMDHVADLIDRARDTVGFDGTEYTIEKAPHTSAPTDAAKALILDTLKDFIHCGDYGNAWWNPDDGVLWLTLGDSDGDTEGGYSDFEVFKEKLLALELEPGTDLVSEVLIEAEYDPDEDYWVEFGKFGRELTVYDTLHKDWQTLIHACCFSPFGWAYSDNPILQDAYVRLKDSAKIQHEIVEMIRPILFDKQGKLKPVIDGSTDQ